MANTTGEIVIEILASHTKVKPEQITPTTSLQDLAIDSLGMVEVVFDLEERFDIQLPDSSSIAERFKTFGTPGDIIRAVEELVAQKT